MPSQSKRDFHLQDDPYPEPCGLGVHYRCTDPKLHTGDHSWEREAGLSDSNRRPPIPEGWACAGRTSLGALSAELSPASTDEQSRWDRISQEDGDQDAREAREATEEGPIYRWVP